MNASLISGSRDSEALILAFLSRVPGRSSVVANFLSRRLEEYMCPRLLVSSCMAYAEGSLWCIVAVSPPFLVIRYVIASKRKWQSVLVLIGVFVDQN
jgi:hypothetical protein